MDSFTAHDANLSQHRIDRVQILKTRARYPRLHGKNAIKGYHGYGGDVWAVEITTDQGASGWGVLCQPYTPDMIEQSGILDKRITDVFLADTGILSERYAAFDIALHDLAGRILGIPVSRMVNPSASSYARVYDGAVYMNDIIPEDRPFGVNRILSECEADYALGHRTFKIKIGRGHMWMEHDAGMARDIEVVEKIHKIFPDAVLMVDANDGYSVEDAITFLDRTSPEIYWFEEPFRECEESNAKLKEYLRHNRPTTYIADGESYTDIALLFDLAEKGLLDVWQPDIVGYGFTPWRKIMTALQKNGYLASPHAWGQVIKTHYCAHLAAAYPHHISYVEAVLGDTEGIDYSEYRLNNGILSVPQKPGFGMELYWAEKI